MSNAQKQRGIKRNATDLLATSNQHDIHNPRPSKRQRTSNEAFQATLQTLLTMKDEDINQLQEPLRQQALALRAERNISNPPHNRHNNDDIHPISSDAKPALMQQHETLMEISSDEESEDEDDEDDYILSQNTNNSHITHSNNNNISASKAQNPAIINHNAYNTNYNNSSQRHTAPQNPRRVFTEYNHNTIPQQAVPLKVSPAIHVAPQPFSQKADTNILHHEPTFVDSLPPHIDDIDIHSHRYINVQDLIGKNEQASSKCYCLNRCLRIIVCVVFAVPFFMAIPLSNRYGTNYCDTDARVIRAYGDYNCVECPLNAKYCIKGEAWCEDTSYWVDPEINECVKREYMKQVTYGYKHVWKNIVTLVKNGGMSMMDYYNMEISKWQSVKEWKAWYQTLKQLSFVQFCKLYQMEVMVSFAVFSWYFPMMRCLIIFLWTRMILPTVDEGDDQLIIIYLKLLSYFAPILFGYDIWNKIVAGLAAEK